MSVAYSHEAQAAEFWLAGRTIVSDGALASKVLRGDSEGRNLLPAHVLHSLNRVRAQQVPPTPQAHVALEPSARRHLVVCFPQEPKTLRIFGAAAASIAH